MGENRIGLVDIEGPADAGSVERALSLFFPLYALATEERGEARP